MSCDGTHGTWRIATAESPAIAYLYLSISEHTGEEHFLLYTLDEAGEGECRRYADYVPEGDPATAFWVSEQNLGGTVNETCGDPGEESIAMAFIRRTECFEEVFDLSLERPGSTTSPLVEGRAIHCRCDVDWDSLGGDPVFPQDGCLGP